MNKSIFTVDIVAFLALFFIEIQAAVFAIGFLILTDTFTGVWGSIKKNGKSSITSRKAGRIISKLILYPLALIVAKVSEDYLAPSIPILSVTTGIIATVEVKSIFENMSILLGFDLWSKIKSQLWKPKDEEDKEKL